MLNDFDKLDHLIALAASGSLEAEAKELENMGVVATVRRRLGADVNAACGQLRRTAGTNQS